MQSTENARKWLEMVQDYVQIDELTLSIEIHYNLRPIEGHRDL